jgi:transmembrane sensor
VSKPEPMAADIARLRDASEWIQRLNESNTQTVVDQWFQWCKSDPRNLPAFERMQGIWDALYRAPSTALHLPQSANRRKHRGALIALAASIAVLVGVVGWTALRYSNVQVLDTAIGERRSITLADGSALDLAPDSRVSTRFTLVERDVKLERGQAFFAVAHSTVRPFIVHVNNLKVTAVGTAFDVRIDPSGTVVTVSEGRVNVAPVPDEVGAHPPTNAGTVRAGVGERVTFSNSARRLSVATVDPKVAESWRDGNLQFEDDPLEVVVGVVNRYGAPHIVLARALRQTRFTGTVSPKHVRDWLEALEQIYAVEMVDQGSNGVLIRSRTDDGTQK